MAYGTPANPVGGTVITVAYATANLLDPIRWLRLLTGNADPPGSNYVVVSTGTAGTSWQKVPADALAAGVALANLGYTPVNKVGDSMTGQLVIFRTQAANSTAFANGPLVVQSPDAIVTPAEAPGIGFHRSNVSGVYLYHAGLAAADWLRFITHSGVLATIWHSLNQGSGSGLDADTLRTLVPGSSNGNLAILGAGGKVAAAVAADTAASATSATNATNATTATNATQLGGVAASGYQPDVAPLSAAPGGVTVGASADISGSTLTLATAGKWLVTAKAIVAHGAGDTIAVRLMQDASTIVDQAQAASTAGGTQTVPLTAEVTSTGSTTVKLNSAKLGGSSTSTLSAIVITASFVGR